MSDEKMRGDFEVAYTAYCEKNGLGSYTAFHMLSEVYVKASTELAWQMWQASRAAIVVELPETPNHGIGYGLFAAGKEACAEAIEAAGLKVKS